MLATWKTDIVLFSAAIFATAMVLCANVSFAEVIETMLRTH
jgi:hypothetical protein